MKTPRNPLPTADAIIEMPDGAIVLIERKNPPHGWALPGGFIDYGESAENAAVREAKEETGLDVRLVEQFHTYSAPDRDPRHHTITIVFIARAEGTPQGGDDAARAVLAYEGNLPEPLVFDHEAIVLQYFEYRRSGRRPCSA